MKGRLTVIILTKNEEANLPQCLAHLIGWADEVIVLDSRSTDRTADIARAAGATVVTHPFENYVAQRNWALHELPVRNDWVFFLDADEYPTEELKDEINKTVNDKQKTVNGYYIRRRFIWRGRWIWHGGYYPVWILRLMKRGKARCEGQLMDEHFVVEGETGCLEHDFVHDDRRGLEDWKMKHRRYAVLKAKEYWERKSARHRSQAIIDDTEQKRRAMKRVWYDRLPLFFRAVCYFMYVFCLRLGFLDGPAGWEYHLLRGLWYPWLIDREIIRSKDLQAA